MAVLWDDVQTDMASAKHHFAQAIAIYRDALTGAADYVPIMAFQHAMQSGYTSLEAGMRRILHLLDEPVPAGPDWHAALVRRLGRAVPDGRPALFEGRLQASVEELRRFRYVAMHAYDDFAPRRASIPVEAAEHLLGGLDGALAAFREALDR